MIELKCEGFSRSLNIHLQKNRCFLNYETNRKKNIGCVTRTIFSVGAFEQRLFIDKKKLQSAMSLLG